MIKQMDCLNFFPGYVEIISRDYLSNILSRYTKEDNQRCTPDIYYIYHSDNFLGGK